MTADWLDCGGCEQLLCVVFVWFVWLLVCVYVCCVVCVAVVLCVCVCLFAWLLGRLIA